MYTFQENVMAWLVIGTFVLLGLIVLVELLTPLRDRFLRQKAANGEPEPWMHTVTPADPSLPLYNAASESTDERGDKLRSRHYRRLERQDRNYYGFYARQRRH